MNRFPQIKREALHLLIELQDEAVLAEVHRILSQGDWWDALSAEDQEGIDQAGREFEQGDFYTHEEVMTRAKEWTKR